MSGGLSEEKAGVPSTFKIALCQMPVTDSKPKNLETAREYLLKAKTMGAALAVLPECFNSPYDTGLFKEYAEPLPEPSANDPPPVAALKESPSLAMLLNVAASTAMYIVGGSIPEVDSDGNLYNTSVSVSPNGKVLAKHRKTHLFDINVPGRITFQESSVLKPGNKATCFRIDELGINVGVAICYDLRFPDFLAIQARKHGVELMILPGAFNMTTGPAHWELLLRARALDNQIYVAGCSPSRPNSGDGYKAWGHSMVVDPWGTVVASVKDTPEIALADVALKHVHEVRTNIPTSKQRRDDIYNLEYVKE